MVVLTPLQVDILQEFINIGIGKAAGIINQMSRIHVILKVPEISIMNAQELRSAFQERSQEKFSAVTLGFHGNFSGRAALVFPPESAASLVSIIIGSEDTGLDMDSLRIGTLQEVGNIVLNGVMGSITNIVREHIDYLTPDYREDSFQNIMRVDDEKLLILIARTQFTLENQLIQGDIVILFHLQSFDAFVAAIDRVGGTMDSV
jgi:chemotaxis protein CheC